MADDATLQRLHDEADARITRALAAVRRRRARLRKTRDAGSLDDLDALQRLAHDLEVTAGTR